MQSVRCHIEYSCPLTGERLSKTACQQLRNVSGLSAFIRWPTCASGLLCPSTPIYSLAASTVIFPYDTFFPLPLQVSNSELLWCVPMKPPVAIVRWRTAALGSECYSNFRFPIIKWHQSFSYLHHSWSFPMTKRFFISTLLHQILFNGLSLWLLATKQLGFLVSDHPQPSFYCVPYITPASSKSPLPGKWVILIRVLKTIS